jgi:type I restriction enzyme R subunit
MPGFYTEADYENSIIELFENLGYRHVYAPDLERDFYSPLYEEELESALHRLNPEMPEDAIADAFTS